jgi:hypothetical protein
VAAISPFYDAGLSIEMTVHGLAMHVPHLGYFRLGIVRSVAISLL